MFLQLGYRILEVAVGLLSIQEVFLCFEKHLPEPGDFAALPARLGLKLFLLFTNFAEFFHRKGTIAVALIPQTFGAFYRLLPIIKTGNVVVGALGASDHGGVVRIGGNGVGDFDATKVPVTYGFGGSTGLLNACGRHG